MNTQLTLVMVVIVILYGTKTALWALKPWVKSRFWLTTIAFFIVCLTLLALTARNVEGQEVPVHYGLPVPDFDVYTADLPPEWMAWTDCDSVRNVPFVVLDNATVENKAELGLTFIHETVHVLQAYYYPGGCNAFLARYRTDARFRYIVELEAHCTALAFREDNESYISWLVDYFWLYSQGVEPRYLTFFSKAYLDKHVRDICTDISRITGG